MSKILLLGCGSPSGALPDVGLILWLDGDDLFDLDHDDKVYYWPDKSGGGNNAIQPDDDLAPRADKTHPYGHTAVRGDGSQSMYVPSLTMGKYTIFCAWKSTGGIIVYEHSANTNDGNGCYLSASNDATIQTRRVAPINASSYDQPSSSWGHDNTWRITTHTMDGTNAGHTLRVDGIQESMVNAITNDPGTSLVSDQFNLFSRNQSSLFLTGHIGEILVYNRVLQNSQRELVENYLKTKWLFSV